MSLNEGIKQFQSQANAGKGNNETLEIVHPVEHTTAATDAADVHVPGNGGTCHSLLVDRKGKHWLQFKDVKQRFNHQLLNSANAGGKTLTGILCRFSPELSGHFHFPSCGAD
jgi:hypothetical protein